LGAAGLGLMAGGIEASGEGSNASGRASPKPTDVVCSCARELGRSACGMTAAPSATTTANTPSQATIRMGEHRV